MKTLDEVIKAYEICIGYHCSNAEHDVCPYFGESDMGCMKEPEKDALHYLKEYRSDKAMWEADRKGYLDWIEQYKEAREKHQQAVIELKKNPPLTWDELRTMEGKPVWVEGNHGCIWGQKAWSLIRLDSENDDIVICINTDNGVHYEFAIGQEDYGTDWQAYRKERE